MGHTPLRNPWDRAYGSNCIQRGASRRGLLVGPIAIFVICAAQNRKVALGCAFSRVALRMEIGIITSPYPLAFVA
jgi:hypothetical protein